MSLLMLFLHFRAISNAQCSNMTTLDIYSDPGGKKVEDGSGTKM